MDGHLFFPTFWLLWITVLWTLVYRFLCGQRFSFCPNLWELLARVITACSTFWGIAKLFSKGHTSFYVPTSNVYRFQLLHIRANTCHCLFFNYSHPSKCEVVTLWLVATRMDRVGLSSEGLKWIQSQIISSTFISFLKPTFTEPLLSGGYYTNHHLRWSHLILIIPPAVGTITRLFYKWGNWLRKVEN